MAQTKKATPAPATAPKKEQESRPAVIALKAKIQKLVDNPESRIKAIASVNIGGEYAIHGIKVIDSEKGRFISMPNEKWTDQGGNTKYKDTFYAITAEARTNLANTVMAAYEQALAESQEQSGTPAEESEASADEAPDPAQKL